MTHSELLARLHEIQFMLSNPSSPVGPHIDARATDEHKALRQRLLRERESLNDQLRKLGQPWRLPSRRG